ncbi:15-hydroxyprostaglandin dehydrogenase [NAD(+)]-like [Trichoplusia ni]|uniref:15-hydroxyprostaglandin dehydrogenase [NAD(+)]-like n=1 Tax=Trichoplusia ni TaxID=7111 RepID=A0A7E5VLJ0_TRINI|nr:15-hydroxyprostaglandin dehydrogenase [NAD(+)]-like [Trichoplusia ni]
MATNLANKVIVITGGGGGIGSTTADKYLEQGAKLVILLDNDEKNGADTAKQLTTKYGENKAIFIKCDLTSDVDEVSKRIFENYTVDVLVNNAGIYDETKLKLTINVNVTAVIELGLKFWNHMRKDKGGRGGTIINLASIYGYRVDPYISIYQASKFAVMGFTRSLGHADNFKRSGVRVVAICPGFTRTNMTAKLTTTDSDLMQEFDEYTKNLPWQAVEAVGGAAVDVFQRAESGTAWLIEGGKPIEEVKS